MGLIMIFLVLIAQFYIALFPLGQSGVGTAECFFKAYLALPVIILFWVCGYFWKRAGWLTLSQIDINPGRREIDWEEHHAIEVIRNSNFFVRLAHILF
ncbi:hypothetical protein M432DRAFT_672092 [Thermoascus aurantiacus ATCC 26904]